MPPRRNAKRSSRADRHVPILPSIPSDSPSTAAERVFRIGEIRCRILESSDPASLTILMRVEKGLFVDAGRELYRNIRYRRVEGLLRMEDAVRRQILLDSVVHIDATYIKPSNELRELLGFDPIDDSGSDSDSDSNSDPGWKYYESDIDADPGLDDLLLKYNPDVFNIIIPPLLKHFKALRIVEWGCGGNPETWQDALVLRIHPNRPTLPLLGPSPPFTPRDIGHIDLYTKPRFVSNLAPPRIHPPTPPSSGYTLTERSDIDFDVFTDEQRSDHYDEWISTIRDSPYFDNVYTEAFFGYLPRSLDDLTSLYERQHRAGHDKRMKTIIAYAVPLWSPTVFDQFASVALSSLTSLHLMPRSPGSVSIPMHYREGLAGSSFSDLALLVSSIKRQLPNLKHLDLPLSGADTADDVCRELLSPDCLEEGGKLERVEILSGPFPTSKLNVIRCLSFICSTGAYVNIRSVADTRDGIESDESRMFQYLRKQSATRRAHLATADFNALGVFKCPHLLELEYDEEDHPVSRITSLTRKWAGAAQKSEQMTNGSIIPMLSAKLAGYSEASAQLQALAASGASTSSDLLGKAEVALAAAKRVVLNKYMWEIASGGAEKAVGEMEEYIEALKAAGVSRKDEQDSEAV